MAIGNYWACVLSDAIENPLQTLIDGTTILSRQIIPSWHLQPGGKDLGPADFQCLASPAGDI